MDHPTNDWTEKFTGKTESVLSQTSPDPLNLPTANSNLVSLTQFQTSGQLVSQMKSSTCVLDKRFFPLLVLLFDLCIHIYSHNNIFINSLG